MKSQNFQDMVKRKQLIRKGGEVNERAAEKILQRVEENGGLTAEETYALMAH